MTQEQFLKKRKSAEKRNSHTPAGITLFHISSNYPIMQFSRGDDVHGIEIHGNTRSEAPRKKSRMAEKKIEEWLTKIQRKRHEVSECWFWSLVPFETLQQTAQTLTFAENVYILVYAPRQKNFFQCPDDVTFWLFSDSGWHKFHAGIVHGGIQRKMFISSILLFRSLTILFWRWIIETVIVYAITNCVVVFIIFL